MIGCVVVSDRGDLYLPDTLRNLADNLHPSVPVEVVDDSEPSTKRGLAGSVRAAWQLALDRGWNYLLHWEEDFRAVVPVPLFDMKHALDRFPNVSQVVLKRQPWSSEERAAGGIVEMHPHLYQEASVFGRSYSLTVHRRIFSLNPCLIPRRVLELGWPDDNEAGMTTRLNLLDDNLFAFYGARNDPPRVEHVGAVRSVSWAL